MSYYIIIFLCLTLLISYLFEITSKYTKIPGVILLMIFGLLLRYITEFNGFKIPDFSILLPVMGTLGLILIVLEGSLDLTLSSDKQRLFNISFATSFILFSIFLGIFTLILHYYFKISFKTAIINLIPLGIISSAVAIPSSRHLHKDDRDFIVYESSISDIIGILLFDFVLFNNGSVGRGVFLFIIEVVLTIVSSVIISAGLAYMLHKIGHHVKYIIILTVVVLIFILAKLAHWPSLLVVLIFGIILNNNQLFQSKFTKRHIDFQEFNKNLISFKQITGEFTFLIRSFFFLIFGYYTSLSELFNPHTLILSITICISIFLLRGIFFRYILRQSSVPLLFFAPRGLITILLFLGVPAAYKLSFMSEGLISQIIFITILVMALGNILSKPRGTIPYTETKSNEYE
jgi:potassium/hydrogen antiporter